MSKIVIDVNNISTYPATFLDFCSMHKEILLNTFPTSNIKMDSDSDLFETIDRMFYNSYFKCLHATRTCDMNCIKDNGLKVPKNEEDLVDIILTPIADILDTSLYEKVYKKMSEKVKQNDKYSTVHFVLGSLEDISIDNGFLMLNNYGGELLEDIFSMIGEKEYYDNNISKLGIPSAVLFELEHDLFSKFFLNEIYIFMLKKLLYNSEEHFFKTNYILSSVPKENIIDIFEIKLDGDYHE